MSVDYDQAEPVEVAIGAIVVVAGATLVAFVTWRLLRRAWR